MFHPGNAIDDGAGEHIEARYGLESADRTISTAALDEREIAGAGTCRGAGNQS
jgi:hypothetical protein